MLKDEVETAEPDSLHPVDAKRHHTADPSFIRL